MPPMVDARLKMPSNGKLSNTNAKTNKPINFDCLLAMRRGSEAHCLRSDNLSF